MVFDWHNINSLPTGQITPTSYDDVMYGSVVQTTALWALIYLLEVPEFQEEMVYQGLPDLALDVLAEEIPTFREVTDLATVIFSLAHLQRQVNMSAYHCSLPSQPSLDMDHTLCDRHRTWLRTQSRPS